MMAADPYGGPRRLMFWFLAVVTGLLALGAVALVAWAAGAVALLRSR